MKRLIFLLTMMSFCESQGQQIIDKEQMYIHLNKTTFHVGEIAWFRLYTLNGRNFQPIGISKLCYVEILDARNVPFLQAKISLEDGQGSGSFLLPPTLRSGSYQIRAYTNWMKNFGPSAFATHTINIINAADFSQSKIAEPTSVKALENPEPERFAVAIATDKSIYRNRELVRVQLTTTDQANKPAAANLSVSVYRVDSLTTGDAEDMLTALKNIVVPDNPPLQYVPEFHGHIVNGMVVDQQGKAVAGKEAYLGIPGMHSRFYCGSSDSGGHVRFEIKDFSNADRVLVQTDYFTDSALRVAISDPFSKEYAAGVPAAAIELRQFPNTVLAQSVSAQVQGLYYADTLNTTFNIIKDTLAFYGKPSMSYELDNYVRFPTMEAVFAEYIRPVVVRRRGKRPHLFVFFENQNDLFTNDPLVLLDGIPVFQISKLFRYNPLKVQRIDIMQRKYYRGMSVFDGVVDLHTYKSIPEGYEPDVNATVIPYEGLQRQRMFYSPAYDNEEKKLSRLPDYRSTLFWLPEIQVDSSGKLELQFFSGDLPGTYAIVVHGITGHGQVASQSTTIGVGAASGN